MTALEGYYDATIALNMYAMSLKNFWKGSLTE
jgi:hypothetical protein